MSSGEIPENSRGPGKIPESFRRSVERKEKQKRKSGCRGGLPAKYSKGKMEKKNKQETGEFSGVLEGPGEFWGVSDEAVNKQREDGKEREATAETSKEF